MKKVTLLLFMCIFLTGGTMLNAGSLPVDYVNPYMGNISHLLVPTYPTVHLPNSILRVYPERGDFTGNQLFGLPIVVTSHRGSSAFNLCPYQGDEKGLKPVVAYTYDREKITPYRYQVYLDEQNIDVDFAPSHQSAVYELRFEQSKPTYIILNSRNGVLKTKNNVVSGFQSIDGKTKIYLYAELSIRPLQTTTLQSSAVVLSFGDKIKTLGIRYGVSFISEEQAKKNLQREINTYDVGAVAQVGRDIWNEALGKIKVTGVDDNQKAVFYTSLYRCFERPVCLSEDGNYYSAFDGKVHKDEGRAFYTDDWLWDTYRAAHPLRILLDSSREEDILNSYLIMAHQMGKDWMP